MRAENKKLPFSRNNWRSRLSFSAFAAALAFMFVLSIASHAQSTPVVVQPGAPGQPTRELPAGTRAQLPPVSRTDVGFMQGMIMHHNQAVEMVALMDGRVQSKELRLLGARISHTQSEEMKFMERWLQARGEKTSMEMPNMEGMDHSHMDHSSMLMPGMLTPKQMKALAAATGKEFDRLFLTGMIQHHNGALIMVKELFDSPGAGQEANLFNFATDIDSGQRAEIRIMQEMLKRL